MQISKLTMQAGSTWLHIYPKGIWDLLLYVKTKYKDPIIYITENGTSQHFSSSPPPFNGGYPMCINLNLYLILSGADEVNNPTLPLKQALQDSFRSRYYYQHLQYVRKAIK